MADTIRTDDQRRADTAQPTRERSDIDEGLIEQLARGTSWATQTELIEHERSDI